MVVSNLKITWLEPDGQQQVQVAAIRVTSQFHSVFIFGGKGLAKQRHMYCMVDPGDGKGMGKGSYGKPLYCVALDIGRAWGL